MITYKELYMLRKNTYWQLKQLGGASEKVKTIANNGSIDKMTNQCFWISILNYLNLTSNVSMIELRKNANLDKTTEHMMFDIDYVKNGKVIFYNAAINITEIYDLKINVFGIDHYGFILGQRAQLGNGNNIVNIAQFGLHHFELHHFQRKMRQEINSFSQGIFLDNTYDINNALNDLS